MVVLAPALAVARVAKAAKDRAVEGEFARWFRPVEGEAADPRGSSSGG